MGVAALILAGYVFHRFGHAPVWASIFFVVGVRTVWLLGEVALRVAAIEAHLLNVDKHRLDRVRSQRAESARLN